MSVRDRMIATLNRQFTPSFLEVIDESHRHAGHAGANPEGESHFRVRIAAKHFDGLARLAQHRAVMAALDGEIKGGVHALAVEIVPADGPVKPRVEG